MRRATPQASTRWSNHFATAMLRSPLPASRRGEAARLVVLNVGIAAVPVGSAIGEGNWRWLGVAGSAVVFAAVLAHVIVLAVRLRRALPAPFTITVYYYLAAAVALLVGIPAGSTMLVTGVSGTVLLFDDRGPRTNGRHSHLPTGSWWRSTMARSTTQLVGPS